MRQPGGWSYLWAATAREPEMDASTTAWGSFPSFGPQALNREGLMLEGCDFYHKKRLTVVPGTEGDRRIIHKLCPSCRARLEKWVDQYVEKLAHRKKTAPEGSASGR